MNRFTLPGLSLLAAGVLCAAGAFAQLKPPEGMIAPAPGPAAPSAPSGPAQGAGAPPPQSDPTTREFRDCIRSAQEGMEAKKQDDPAAIGTCLTAETKRQEGKLASAAGKAALSLTGAEKKRLDDANGAWRRYRDANCGFYSDAKISALAAAEFADCSLRHTISRALEVETIASVAARRNASKSGK